MQNIEYAGSQQYQTQQNNSKYRSGDCRAVGESDRRRRYVRYVGLKRESSAEEENAQRGEKAVPGSRLFVKYRSSLFYQHSAARLTFFKPIHSKSRESKAAAA